MMMPTIPFLPQKYRGQQGPDLRMILRVWSVLFFSVQGPWLSLTMAQTCPGGTNQIIVSIRTDNYPQESSYRLQDQNGNTVGFRNTGYYTANNTTYRDTFCVPSSTCLIFTMMDSYGDGLCCAYGNGQFQLWLNGTLSASGGQFTRTDVRSLNCGISQSCQSPQLIDTGNYSAPTRNSSIPGFGSMTIAMFRFWPTIIWEQFSLTTPAPIVEFGQRSFHFWIPGGFISYELVATALAPVQFLFVCNTTDL
jgi:hypothetical protein